MSTNPNFINPATLHWHESDESSPPQESFNFLVSQSDTYYRSKAFVSQISVNPLVAASAPLFFLIEKVKSLSTCPDIHKLHDDLIHEVNAFEHQAQIRNYRAYIILAAKYMLCLWMDEVILSTSWREHSNWETLCLTKYSEETQGKPLYALLNRCFQEPDIYIDLLELFYLCLSLGFKGNDTPAEVARLNVNETRDLLFEIIHKQRAGFSKKLEINTTLPLSSSNFFRRICLRTTAAVSVVCILSGVYVLLNTRLESLLESAFVSHSTAQLISQNK